MWASIDSLTGGTESPPKQIHICVELWYMTEVPYQIKCGQVVLFCNVAGKIWFLFGKGWNWIPISHHK